MRPTTAEHDTDEREVQRLQQALRDQQAALDAVKPGTTAYEPAVAAVLEATVALVNHEAGIPIRRKQSCSAHTAKIVERVGLLTTVILAAAALLALTSWLSSWWLVLLVPLLILAGLIAVTAHDAAPSDRCTRRDTAIGWAVTVGVDLALLAVSPLLPYWLTTMLMGMATAGGLAAANHLLLDAHPGASSGTGD